MHSYKDILLSLLKRVLIAVPFVALSFFLLSRAGGGGSLLGAYAMGLLGCASMIAVAIVVAFPLARLIAEPSGSLYWPTGRFDRPQPMYGIPQSKRAKGLYEQAMAGYEKIIRDYPGELKPYVEMIDIAVVDLRDPDRATWLLNRGLAVLKKEEDRATLSRIYSAIITRLTPRSEWLQQQMDRILVPPTIESAVPVDEPDGRLKRRFHAGSDGQYEGKDSDRYVDTRDKVPYSKKRAAEHNTL